MSRPFHRPVRRPADVIDEFGGTGDPAEVTEFRHQSAAALLHRLRSSTDPQTVNRVLSYIDQHGVDDVAELWAGADARSLPGALWRLFLLRVVVTGNPDEASYRFRRGIENGHDVDQAVAGTSSAPTPVEMVSLANEILRGAFAGDFAVALERAAAFCSIVAAGSSGLACPEVAPAQAEQESNRAGFFRSTGEDLKACAALWRNGQLH